MGHGFDPRDPPGPAFAWMATEEGRAERRSRGERPRQGRTAAQHSLPLARKVLVTVCWLFALACLAYALVTLAG